MTDERKFLASDTNANWAGQLVAVNRSNGERRFTTIPRAGLWLLGERGGFQRSNDDNGVSASFFFFSKSFKVGLNFKATSKCSNAFNDDDLYRFISSSRNRRWKHPSDSYSPR